MKENASKSPTKEDFMRAFLFCDSLAFFGRGAKTRNVKVKDEVAACFRVWMDFVDQEQPCK